MTTAPTAQPHTSTLNVMRDGQKVVQKQNHSQAGDAPRDVADDDDIVVGVGYFKLNTYA